MLQNRFTERYGLTVPLAQAGMAFAGMTPPLGIAVSNAGAMGSIAGVGILPPEAVEMLVGGVQAGTGKPFHVNFITRYMSDPLIDLMCRMKPAAVSFHWGHPEQVWIDRLHGAGIDVWEQVGSVEAARTAAAAGVDVIVAQGAGAGGHNYGSAGTIALTPAIVDAVGDRAMILAAGGIADGRGLAAALMLGADGAWVGTRFVATREAAVAAEYKDRIVAAGVGDTTRTHVFGRHDPAFNPMRVLKTALIEEWDSRIDAIPPGDENNPLIGQMSLLGQPTPMHKFTNMVPMEGATGDFDLMALLAGESVGLITDLPGAAEVVARFAQEAADVLKKVAG